MDIDCLAHKRWITFLVLYQNGSRMTAAHNWKVLWTVMVWPWAVGWLCVFPLFVFAVFSSLTGSRLPTSGPVGVAAVSATAERRTCRPADLHLLVADRLQRAFLPAYLPAGLPHCVPPISQRKTKLNNSVTFDRCLHSSCLLVLTKTPTYCKKQHWK